VKAFEELQNKDVDLVLVGGKSAYQNQIEDYIQQKNIKGFISSMAYLSQIYQLYTKMLP
jgi:hypothetical protein